MLSLRDSLTLATTKLRVRRVRLIVTLIVAGTLFTTLVFASLVIRGSLQSLESFVNDGLLNRFMTATYRPYDFEATRDKQFIERAEKLQAANLAEQAKEARRLGLPYDPQTARKAVTENTMPDGKKEKTVDTSVPYAQQAFVELHPDTAEASLRKLAGPYNTKAIYATSQLSLYGDTVGHEYTPILEGKEIASTAGKEPMAYGPSIDPFESFAQSLVANDNGILEPFVLKGATLKAGPGDPLPIVAPVDAAEKLLKLKPLGPKATPAERLERLKLLREKATNLTFDICYRNGTASALRQQAKQQVAEIATQSKVAGYQKPPLTYAQPTDGCQPTAIAADTRSAEDKVLANKQEEFEQKFGKAPPVTQRISFKIIGLTAKLGSLAEANGPEGLIGSLFTSTLGEGWFVSRQATLQHPILGKIITDPYLRATGNTNYMVEFPDRASQKRFITDKACNAADPRECEKQGKVMAFAFGNPLATLYELQDGFNTGLRYALLVIAILSAIVMMGTIGKIIADSRKETSVFRAVGAKRLDIAQVYLLYTAILASLSFLVALGLGLAAAAYLEANYASGLSVQAVLAFNSSDLNKTFHLMGVHLPDFAGIYGFVLAVALISAIIPLLTNIRRNPVKDMREE